MTRRQAQIHHRLLGEERHRLVVERAAAKADGREIDVKSLNRLTEEITGMQEELTRAMDERGWLGS